MPLLERPLFPAPSDCLALGPAYGVVVIGGSAGGITALIDVLGALPEDFALPVLVVQHLSAKRALSSQLPAILGWRTRLRVTWAEHGERLAPGTVYVAPADQHLTVAPGERIALSAAPPVGPWRPAVNTLFHSAAQVYGERAVAIVLSGMMWDGAAGIADVARAGGLTIAQDEPSSRYFDMPAAAIDVGRADLVMSPREIAETLRLIAEPARPAV